MDSTADQAISDPEAEYNHSGQRFGRKGRQVRENLLEAARELMIGNPLTVPTLTAITAAAGVKITSVYRYYPDVGTLLADAMRPMVQEIQPIAAIIDADWPKDSEYRHALEFARALYAYWCDRRGILFVRNSLAERGDPRFVRLRMEWALPMHTALAGKLGKAHQRRLADPRDLSAARILISGLERTLTMMLHILTFGDGFVGRDVPDPLAAVADICEAFAHIVASLIDHDYLAG